MVKAGQVGIHKCQCQWYTLTSGESPSLCTPSMSSSGSPSREVAYPTNLKKFG